MVTGDGFSEREFNVHIFTVSAQLVGICLTVIGLIRVLVRADHAESVADNMLAIDAVIFLVVCLLAYASIRSRGVRRRRVLERVADVCFLVALLLMTGVCAVIAWELL